MIEHKEHHPACNLDDVDTGEEMNLCCCLIMDDNGDITDPCLQVTQKTRINSIPAEPPIIGAPGISLAQDNQHG